MDAGKYEATQRLQQNCVTLTSKVEQLNGLVQTYLKILDKQVLQMLTPMFHNWAHCHVIDLQVLCWHVQADKIEIEKLKAICVRNAVATLEEVQHDPLAAIPHFTALDACLTISGLACRTENAEPKMCSLSLTTNSSS